MRQHRTDSDIALWAKPGQVGDHCHMCGVSYKIVMGYYGNIPVQYCPTCDRPHKT